MGRRCEPTIHKQLAALKRRPAQVGDVYPAKATGPAGWRHGTRYWLVLATHGNTVHMAGLNKEWDIVSTTSYGSHVLPERGLLFRIKNVEQFALTLKGDRRGQDQVTMGET